MAVENSYLIQQTSRRSEELHVLNEIGRALSSTLNKEDLTRKVWEELRRLFDVENFYIAEMDPLRDEIQFDLEIVDGARLPKRARPQAITSRVHHSNAAAGAHPHNYVGEMKNWALSRCAQRMLLRRTPRGLRSRHRRHAVYSDHERVFDEGHLELLRVLASEASIAIENARLFNEERTKARHLSLLNTISRNAIATLNPDEMLAKITEQLEAGLTTITLASSSGLRDARSGDPGRSGSAPRDLGAAHFPGCGPDWPRGPQWTLGGYRRASRPPPPPPPPTRR